LSEVHAGVCRGHIGAKALATKVLRQGFYWPAMIDDVVKLVSTCQTCQRFSRKTKALAQPVQLIASSWPLQRWGTDVVGKLTPAQGNYTFAVVAVEYFTKWIEAKPLTNVSSATIKKFFWQNIICRYGVPRHITVDNAKYFDNEMFKKFCQQIGTKVTFTSVYHPQSNGAVERANSLIFEAMKKILEGEKKRKMGGGHANRGMEP
jgi:IS30 family transposase